MNDQLHKIHTEWIKNHSLENNSNVLEKIQADKATLNDSIVPCISHSSGEKQKIEKAASSL